MVDKRLLAVFIVTSALGLAVVLDLFQLHVHSVIPCLCLLPPASPEGLQLGNYVCAEGTDIIKFDKTSTDLSCFISQFMGFVAFWEAKPIKVPVATGLVTNRCLFRKLYYQSMPAGTKAFCMLSSDYNVLSSTVIATNNFIQCTHCQAEQPIRLTLFSIKALTTIISKYIVYPCARFSD